MSNLKDKWKKRNKLVFSKVGRVIPKYPTMTSGSGNYYNHTVDMSHLPNFPGDLASYCSTDHDATGQYDGIYMSYRKNGVWYTYDEGVASGDFDYLTSKPAANPIYRDTTAGSQCETPFIVWVEDKFVLNYQMYGVGTNQSTLRALGADGVNFTRDRVVLDYLTGTVAGNGHTGYLRWGSNPFPRVQYKFVGYALHGGLMQCCGCNDPRIDDWTMIAIMQRQTGEVFYGTGVPDTSIVEWNTADAQSIRQVGRSWHMLVGVGPASSGTQASKKASYWIPLADDGFTVVGKPILAIDYGIADSYDEYSAQITTIVDGECFYDAITTANLRTTAAAIVEESAEKVGTSKLGINVPVSALVTSFNFATTTSKPTGLTAVVETAAAFDYTTNVKITAAFDDGAYLFMDNGFIPNNCEFVEWWVNDFRTTIKPTTRSVMIGFASNKAKLADQVDTIMISSGVESDNGALKFIQIVGSAVVSNELLTTGWPLGWFNSYDAQSKKSHGIRWYPQIGVMHLIGENGQTYDVVTVDASFDKSKTLYPFLGMRNVLTGYVSDETFKLARFKIKAL